MAIQLKIDRSDTVTYREIVPELLNEPNYLTAIEALQAIA